MRFCTSAEAIKESTETVKPDGIGGAKSAPPSDRVWPVVRFIRGREMMCIPQDFTVNNADGGMEARRVQVCSMLLRVRTLRTNINCYSYP